MTGRTPHPLREQYPWIEGDLTISKTTLEAIEQHAVESYPSESCGFVFGPASQPHALSEMQREVNEADTYHLLDPEQFPRTSHTYFKINELKAQRTFEEHDNAANPVKVIYHSHCDAGAYFSKEDSATFATDGVLNWPCAFLVISVIKGAVVDKRLWVHVPNTNTFQEARLTVV